jgi:hypothetical protein
MDDRYLGPELDQKIKWITFIRVVHIWACRLLKLVLLPIAFIGSVVIVSFGYGGL